MRPLAGGVCVVGLEDGRCKCAPKKMMFKRPAGTPMEVLDSDSDGLSCTLHAANQTADVGT